jgi:hypothetical protein
MKEEFLENGSKFNITIDNNKYKCFLCISWFGWNRYAEVEVYKLVKRKFLFFKWIGTDYIKNVNLGEVVECKFNKLIDSEYFYYADAVRKNIESSLYYLKNDIDRRKNEKEYRKNIKIVTEL